MKTKADFQQRIADTISSYAVASPLYQARDPILLAQLEAMASMLAMMSAEQDVAAMEPFTKARDMTVLADASVKGVLPFGTATKVKILVATTSTTPLPITSGRRLLDAQGRVYTVTLGATIPALGSGYIEAVQQSSRILTHTVTASQPFYKIEVANPEIGYIVDVLAADETGAFEYTADFVNVANGDRVFNLMTDENRKLYVQYGFSGVVGFQPDAGSVITMTVTDTEGDIDIAAGAVFAFEYASTTIEAGVKMTMQQVLVPGAAPMDIATMREVCSYPSVYDSNAVYQGNFDFLVRRNLSPFQFLSIWNEQREEQVRGASEDNINTLFISARKIGVDDATLRSAIATIINRADDSYRLKFVAVQDIEIQVVAQIFAQSVYDFAVVEQQARDLILAEYGINSAWAKRGEAKIMYKDLYDVLVDGIQALQDRKSDLRITVEGVDLDVSPEQFRYVSAGSLTVTVEEQV